MIFTYKDKAIAYSITGNGPAVVFIHGFLESRHMWEKVLPHLPQYSTITIDLPGMGDSETLQPVHTMELYAEVIYALLTHLKISHVSLVGHSLGGYVSLAFAEIYPEMTARILLINSTFKADSPERKETRTRAVKLVQERKNAFISMAISNWVTQESQKEFATDLEVLKTHAYTFPESGIIAALEGMKVRKDRSEVALNFTKPKHLLLSEDDPLIPVTETAEEAEKLGFYTQIIAGGHMSVIENLPDTIQFLKERLNT